MGRPIVGITVAHLAEELQTFPRAFYVESMHRAGALSLLIPPLDDPSAAEAILRRLDGLVLSGGGDIAPLLLGETPHLLIGNCQPKRDISELLLARQALEQDLPLLGICRGIQVMAVAAGGSIYQDISSQYSAALEHRQHAPRESPWHEAALTGPAESLLSTLLEVAPGSAIQVNSFHHQAIAQTPSGFRVNAVAPDGVIEGMEKIHARYCLGVQWHPESMTEDVYAQRIFSGLVRSCRNT
ncbi:MAG: type 1 glutamine amidotransferase [Peptococcaceae bacterium]|jgi:putative glutamine amidotransferase|nr:type 1 glutamine amidotransferase [Peptococcaceae bacterium]